MLRQPRKSHTRNSSKSVVLTIKNLSDQDTKCTEEKTRRRKKMKNKNLRVPAPPKENRRLNQIERNLLTSLPYDIQHL